MEAGPELRRGLAHQRSSPRREKKKEESLAWLELDPVPALHLFPGLWAPCPFFIERVYGIHYVHLTAAVILQDRVETWGDWLVAPRASESAAVTFHFGHERWSPQRMDFIFSLHLIGTLLNFPLSLTLQPFLCWTAPLHFDDRSQSERGERGS